MGLVPQGLGVQRRRPTRGFLLQRGLIRGTVFSTYGHFTHFVGTLATTSYGVYAHFRRYLVRFFRVF